MPRNIIAVTLDKKLPTEIGDYRVIYFAGEMIGSFASWAGLFTPLFVVTRFSLSQGNSISALFKFGTLGKNGASRMK